VFTRHGGRSQAARFDSGAVWGKSRKCPNAVARAQDKRSPPKRARRRKESADPGKRRKACAAGPSIGSREPEGHRICFPVARPVPCARHLDRPVVDGIRPGCSGGGGSGLMQRGAAKFPVDGNGLRVYTRYGPASFTEPHPG